MSVGAGIDPQLDAIIENRRRTEAAEAVAFHYDIGNEFYRLWLDAGRTYSCAMPDGPADTLDRAQQRKIRHHLDAVRVDRARRILDIGCGWGAVLRRATEYQQVIEAVGLTLSTEQAAHIRAQRHPRTSVVVTDWADYQPVHRFDGIVSVGAFEHFARPDDAVGRRRAVYREFFSRCRSWLDRDGALSLQTIVYANLDAADANQFMQREIFPNAELPTLADIAEAAEGIFEIESMTNGRLDYAWTCAQWAQRLRARREDAEDIVGAETVARYLRYLTMSSLGFRMGKLGLLRIVLRPYPNGYFGGSR